MFLELTTVSAKCIFMNSSICGIKQRIANYIQYLKSHIAISAQQRPQRREESNSPSGSIGNGLEQVSMFLD